MKLEAEPEYRAVWLVAIIQAGVVIGGTLLVSVMLKWYGYRYPGVSDAFFPEKSRFVRDYGFTLMVIPAIWALATMWSVRKAPRQWIVLLMFGIGIGVALYGIWRYVMIGFGPVMYSTTEGMQ